MTDNKPVLFEHLEQLGYSLRCQVVNQFYFAKGDTVIVVTDEGEQFKVSSSCGLPSFYYVKEPKWVPSILRMTRKEN